MLMVNWLFIPVGNVFLKFFSDQEYELKQAWFGQLKIKIPQRVAGVIWFAEKEGLFVALLLMIPNRRYIKNEINTAVFFCFVLAHFRKPAFFAASVQNINPAKPGLFHFCGERGIRTPGPPVSGQRFSRPPH